MQGLNWVASAQLAQEQMRRELEYMENDPLLESLFDVERLRAMMDRWPAEWDDADVAESYRGLFTTTISAARWARRAREPDQGLAQQ
jgi:hypothetical protein